MSGSAHGLICQKRLGKTLKYHCHDRHFLDWVFSVVPLDYGRQWTRKDHKKKLGKCNVSVSSM